MNRGREAKIWKEKKRELEGVERKRVTERGRDMWKYPKMTKTVRGRRFVVRVPPQ